MFNPIEMGGCLLAPERISQLSAWTHHIPAAFALVQSLQPRVFVELGTHAGDSYCAFCQVVAAQGLSTQCFAVDTWVGDEHSGKYGDEVYQDLRLHHDSRYGHFSQLLRMEFDTARSRFAPGSIDLLHIDGFHSYEAVRHDFETWRDALSERGVVLFHDILVREQDFGVWKLWEELSTQYENFAFDHVHGLGVLLVGDQQPAAFRELVEAMGGRRECSALFDSLGRRVTLEQATLRQQEMIVQQGEELAALRETLAAQQAELQSQQALQQERQAHLEHWVRQSRDLQQQVADLREELDRQQQEHVRQVDELNAMLNKRGALHRMTKAATEWGVERAQRFLPARAEHETK